MKKEMEKNLLRKNCQQIVNSWCGNNTSSKAHFVQNSEVAFSNSTHKNMVNVGPCLSYHDQNYPDHGSRLRTKSKLRILITDPGLRTWYYGIQDYGSGLRIWITNLDYESGLLIRITDLVYISSKQMQIKF